MNIKNNITALLIAFVLINTDGYQARNERSKNNIGTMIKQNTVGFAAGISCGLILSVVVYKTTDTKSFEKGFRAGIELETDEQRMIYNMIGDNNKKITIDGLQTCLSYAKARPKSSQEGHIDMDQIYFDNKFVETIQKKIDEVKKIEEVKKIKEEE